MTAEDLLVYDRRHRQTIETISERLPQLDVVASLALVVEAVDAIYGGALVVASQQEEILRILDLVGEQETDRFEGLFATIDVVAEEKVVGFGREASVLEQTQEVVVLTVDVA